MLLVIFLLFEGSCLKKTAKEGDYVVIFLWTKTQSERLFPSFLGSNLGQRH